MSIASRARQDMAQKARYDRRKVTTPAPSHSPMAGALMSLASILGTQIPLASGYTKDPRQRKTGTRKASDTKPHGKTIRIKGCNEKVTAR
jgi:hypothetical protein